MQILQSLEPAGICARNLQECINLQMKRCGQLSEFMELLIDECLEMVAENKIPALGAPSVKKVPQGFVSQIKYCCVETV